MIEIFVLVLGSLLGSFLAAFSYRSAIGISIAKGRSFCPKCKKTIAWFDNIPLLSFFLLGGKCRNCHKIISKRYPLIEGITAVLFFVSYIKRDLIFSNLIYLDPNNLFSLIFIFVIVFSLIFIFVTDFEHQIILDEVTFSTLIFVFGSLLFFSYEGFYINALAGFSVSLFLLFIHFVTRGTGMGLGDVKFAILAGFILGYELTLSWIFTAFIIGGIFSSILLILRTAKLKQRIAFGPFLVIAFFISLFFGNKLPFSLIF